jgi:photosystem II stability/assembly factor-like uncharacterized protein
MAGTRSILFALALSVALSVAPSFAQAQVNTSVWYLQNPRPTATALKDCAFFEDGHGLAIGDDGTVLQTKDGGAHWQLDRDALGGNSLTAMSTVGTSTVFLAGDPSGVIRVSRDAGATWGTLHTGDANPIQSVFFLSDSEGWAGSQRGSVWHTTDGGRSWQESSLNTPNAGHVTALTVADGRVIAGCGGYIAMSSNDGASWEWTYYPVPSTTIPGVVRSFHFSDATHGLALDDFGWLARTADGGRTWIRASTSYSAGLRPPVLDFKDATHAYMVGSGFTNGMNSGLRCWTSSDAGMTWKIILPRFIDRTGALTAPPVEATSVHFADVNLGWMTDSYGGVYYTLNGGVVWCRSTESFTEESFYEAQFSDENNGLLVGWLDHTGLAGGDVWETHDAGASWRSVLHDSCGLRAIDLAPSGAGWALGTSAIYHRDSSGRWANQYPGVGRWFTDVYTNDGIEGWVTGGLGTIIHTTDGGRHWQSQETAAWGFSGPAAVRSIAVRSNGKGWVCGSYGLENAVLATDNRGATWAKAASFPAKTYKVIPLSGQRVIAATWTGIYASDNDGATWGRVYSGRNVLDISFADDQYGYLRAANADPYDYPQTSGEVWVTNDAGRTWTGGSAPGIGGTGIAGYGDSIWVFGSGNEIAFNGGDGTHLPPPSTQTNIGSGWSPAPFDLRLWGTDPIGVEDTLAKIGPDVDSATGSPRALSPTFAAGKSGGSGYSAWKFPVPMSNEGVTEVHYYSVSLDGKTETTKTAYVRVDLTAPVVKASAKASYRRKASIRIFATDRYSGVKRIEWKVDSGRWHALSRSSVTVVVKKRGRHTISFRSTDRAGHRSRTRKTRSFRVR